jgi:hypothetical protein
MTMKQGGEAYDQLAAPLRYESRPNQLFPSAPRRKKPYPMAQPVCPTIRGRFCTRDQYRAVIRFIFNRGHRTVTLVSWQILTSTIGFHENSSIKWCSPGCSEFWRGERPGVTRASSQRHETSRTATKDMPMGGFSPATELDVSPHVLWRYGCE